MKRYLSIRKKHGALVDSKLLAKVYLELKGGQQPNLVLDSKKEKEEKKEQIFEKKILKDRKFVLSNVEDKKHREFIKKIKNPIWNQYS